jgi:chemosensory pili system protein ChpB (putative protein-glutamate methylesterase)
VSEAQAAPAVALLARPGAARERLREALSHADVQLVLEDDPNGLEPQVLQDARPQFVVIALEAAIEDALERLGSGAVRTGLTLVFDEAELAARRDGWEAQRWGRHLAAKLHGHQQVLPPGAEEEPSLQLEPGHPAPAPAPQEEALQPHLEQALSWADDVPADACIAAGTPARTDRAGAGPGRAAAGGAEPLEAFAAAALADRGAPAPPVSFDHTAWSLVEESSEAPAPAARRRRRPAASFDTDHLSLVDLDAAARGARRIAAGAGRHRWPGCAASPARRAAASLSVPVLVHMRLDGGRYGNLVKQMSRCRRCRCSWPKPASVQRRARCTCWPMTSACRRPATACISSAMRRAFRLPRCRPTTPRWCCSAAPTWHVGPALDLARRCWVAGQVGEGCYDPAAATAVALRHGGR